MRTCLLAIALSWIALSGCEPATSERSGTPADPGASKASEMQAVASKQLPEVRYYVLSAG